MAKKSFTNNPALNFISSAQPKSEEQPEVKEKEVKTKPAKPATKPAKEKPAAKPEEKTTKPEKRHKFTKKLKNIRTVGSAEVTHARQKQKNSCFLCLCARLIVTLHPILTKGVLAGCGLR